MGQKSSKNNLQPLIEIIFASRKLNLYCIPETFNEFEAIAYNFYYAHCDRVCPFESLTLKLQSKGFLRQIFAIYNKSTYKKAIKEISRGTLRVILEINQ